MTDHNFTFANFAMACIECLAVIGCGIWLALALIALAPEIGG